jgi:hypothetical protein
MHEPLSQSLARILESRSEGQKLTANLLIERTDGRGLYLVMIILCLPFIVPVSIPGLSTIMGAVIAVIAARLAVGKEPHLPRSLGERQLPAAIQKRFVGGSVRFLRWLEKFVRPRRTRWLAWRAARFVNAMLIVFMALLLALPIPPIIPFTNSFPGYAIILLAMSMMEEDGVMIWIGYAMALATVIYFAVMAGVISTHLVKWWHEFIHLMEYTQ